MTERPAPDDAEADHTPHAEAARDLRDPLEARHAEETGETQQPQKPQQTDGTAEALDVEHLTWAALLAHWVDFARSSLALPDDHEGKRMRDSVPDLIMLQALWFASQHIDALNAAERSLAADRAQVLLDRHTRALEQRWSDHTLPSACRELIEDTRQAVAGAVERATRDNPADPPT